MTTFGESLAEYRKSAGKTLGQTARFLGITVPYLSDVEKGRRSPLRNELIVKVAEFFQQSPNELLKAAAISRGAFQLETRPEVPKATDVGAALARSWAQFSDKDLDELSEVLDKWMRGRRKE